MAVPESKTELIEAINKNYASLVKKLSAVPAEKAFQPLMEGHAKGTTMSAAQLVSYLIGWGELVLSWHVQEAHGHSIVFPEVGFKWNELGKLAQKFYQDYQNITDYKVLLQRLEKNKNDLLYGSGWCEKYTRGRMIQLNTSSPYRNARGRIATFLKTIGN